MGKKNFFLILKFCLLFVFTIYNFGFLKENICNSSNNLSNVLNNRKMDSYGSNKVINHSNIEYFNNNYYTQEVIYTNNEINVEKNYTNYFQANMINYNLVKHKITYEYFDMNYYTKRNSNISHSKNSVNAVNEVVNYNDAIQKNSDDTQDSSSTYDNRKKINNPKEWPYFGTVQIVTTFTNIFEENDYAIGYATGFMMGPNLMVTAGHVAYTYIEDKENKRISNTPLFPIKIEVFAGLNGIDEFNENSNYEYYAKGSIINIQKEYYDYTSSEEDDDRRFSYDWAAIELDRDLGNITGYYDKIESWSDYKESIFSYGYPNDKGDYSMWETSGYLIDYNKYSYFYNLTSYDGQSGSPVFTQDENGLIYVCGINNGTVDDSSTQNVLCSYGTRINSFIYHYLNSFISSSEHLVTSIAPTDYGFPDAYAKDDDTRNNFTTHTLDNGISFQTRRYRTGYIHNEYIVMSPFRSGFNEAFIEYKFDFEVSKIEVNLSHWRTLVKEWTYSSNATAVLRILNDEGYVTLLDLLSDETNLPTDRNNQTKYTIEFPEGTYSFEFYMYSKRINTNDNNRGRICIGNMNVYSKDLSY